MKRIRVSQRPQKWMNVGGHGEERKEEEQKEADGEGKGKEEDGRR